MKKRSRKLQLHRETLRHLSNTEVGQIAGGTTEYTECNSCDCTASCQAPDFTNCARTFCICAETGY